MSSLTIKISFPQNLIWFHKLSSSPESLQDCPFFKGNGNFSRFQRLQAISKNLKIYHSRGLLPSIVKSSSNPKDWKHPTSIIFNFLLSWAIDLASHNQAMIWSFCCHISWVSACFVMCACSDRNLSFLC